MTVHALVSQCALSVWSYSECKITKIFWGFAPGLHWGGLTASTESPAAQRFFSLRSSKNRQPKKIAAYGTENISKS